MNKQNMGFIFKMFIFLILPFSSLILGGVPGTPIAMFILWAWYEKEWLKLKYSKEGFTPVERNLHLAFNILFLGFLVITGFLFYILNKMQNGS